MPEIILEKVTKRFDKFVAVDNLDLYIADRGFVTLLIILIIMLINWLTNKITGASFDKGIGG